MKNILKSLFTFLAAFLFIGYVNAASANFTVSTSANQVIVGKPLTVYVTISSSVPLGSWEYTLNYDSSVFKCTDSGVGLFYAGVTQNANTYKITYTYKFVAQKSGTGKFYVDSTDALDFNEQRLTPVNGSKAVKVITYAEYEASLSKNNNLASLAVEGYEITPEFSKDVLEYNVQVKEDETSINVIAQTEDRASHVTGIGNLEVTPGSNSFDIVVIAENGDEKKYKLNVEVVDSNPIEVTVDGKKYTVVKMASNLIEPIGYVPTTIKINDLDVPAFESEVTKYTLVGLKDENSDVSLFIYDNGKYTRYVELNFGKLVITALPLEKDLKDYKKSTIIINDNEIECLETSKKSRHKVIYGINVETGEEGLYLYDTKDGSAVFFDEEGYNTISKKCNTLFYVACIFAGITFISLLLLIVVSSKSKSKKKNINIKKEKPEIKEVQEEEDINISEDVEEISDFEEIENNELLDKEEPLEEENIIEEVNEEIIEPKKKKGKKSKSNNKKELTSDFIEEEIIEDELISDEDQLDFFDGKKAKKRLNKFKPEDITIEDSPEKEYDFEEDLKEEMTSKIEHVDVPDEDALDYYDFFDTKKKKNKKR